jgi:hypothetical protein
VGSPPVLSVSLAIPLASVIRVPTVNAPESAAKLTGAPITTLLLASLTNAKTVISEPGTPAESKVPLLVVNRKVGTAVTTLMVLETGVLVPERGSSVAVTVMVRTVELLPVLNVPDTMPLALVILLAMVIAPESAVRLTIAPTTTLLDASFTSTLTVTAVPGAPDDCSVSLLDTIDNVGDDVTTLTCLDDALTLPTDALMVIVRKVESPAMLNLPVSTPFASVRLVAVPPVGAVGVKAPESTLTNTVAFGTTLLLASLARTVTVTSEPLAPEEEIVSALVLNTREATVEPGVVVWPGTSPGEPPPPPHATSNREQDRAAKNPKNLLAWCFLVKYFIIIFVMDRKGLNDSVSASKAARTTLLA